MNDSVHIFLGANSGEGFYSLYDQLLNARFDELLIIKGGPGCGKSSLMRTAAKELAAEGEKVIYVNCSGDPDSLDGVLFPERRAGIVDGTAPHVLEPTYAVANERYLNLTRFCDVEAAQAERAEIVAHTDAYRAAYAEAYHVLRAVDALASERRAIVHAGADFDRLARRRMHKGELCRFETVDALCPRVYELQDSFGLAARALERVCGAAADAGHNVLACLDPDRPSELRHVLIPALGLAFVTSTARLPYAGEAYRRLRLDVMAEAGLAHAAKARLRFTGRVERALRDEAVEALRRAKAEHDALEAAYNPCVDFDGVYTLAAAEAKRLLNGRR